jgi:hypothetical protein
MKRIVVMALSVALALIVASPVASAQVGQGAKASGKAAELAADWWQWALSKPVEDNPLFGGDPNYSEEQCDGQPVSDTPGKKWFLAGTLDGSEVQRTCTIPVGTQLFFPVVNVVVFPFPEETEEDVLAQANEFINSVLADPKLSMSVTVDGKEVIESKRIVRAEAPLFSGESPLLDPEPYEAVADGLWVTLPPLSKGEHTIHVEVSAPNVDADKDVPGIEGFFQDNTYNLTVQ